MKFIVLNARPANEIIIYNLKNTHLIQWSEYGRIGLGNAQITLHRDPLGDG
jgi:hypothetical protein